MIACSEKHRFHELDCLINVKNTKAAEVYFTCECFALCFFASTCVTAFFCWNLSKKANAFKALKSLDSNVFDACDEERISEEAYHQSKEQRENFLKGLAGQDEDELDLSEITSDLMFACMKATTRESQWHTRASIVNVEPSSSESSSTSSESDITVSSPMSIQGKLPTF